MTSGLIDFALVSVLLIIATYMRRHIKILQRYYIPAALIAGILGILLGPHVLGTISPVHLSFSKGASGWTGILTTIIFACSFLGLKLENVSRSAMQTYLLAGIIHQAQVVVGLTLTLLCMYFVTDLPFGLGILPVMALYGGHGFAIATGSVLEEAQYLANGSQVGATFATIGVLAGIIWGMIEVNREARRGGTSIKMKIEDMPEELLTGYCPPGNRRSIGAAVTDSSTLDPLASQFMLVGFIVLCGFGLRTLLINIHPFFLNLPLLACSLIFSAIFTICTQKVDRVNNMIDRATITRISGFCLEYMIALNISITNLSLFLDYGVAIVVVSIGCLIVTYYCSFILARKVLAKNGRFETEVGMFGQACGVLATGLLLLKVIDPDFKTNGATNITSSSTLGYTFQLPYVLIMVPLIMIKPQFVFIVSWVLLVVFLVAGLFFGYRWNKEEVNG